MSLIKKIFALKGHHLTFEELNDLHSPILLVSVARNNYCLMTGESTYILLESLLINDGEPIFNGYNDVNDEEIIEKIESFNMYYDTKFEIMDVKFISKFSETLL